MYFLSLLLRPPSSTLFPYTTLFRSLHRQPALRQARDEVRLRRGVIGLALSLQRRCGADQVLQVVAGDFFRRSEEHTSELQSRRDLVCRLLLEKKKMPIHGMRTRNHL